MCSSVHLCSSVFLPTTPHHHPESPLKKPSRILTARIQATLNRLTSCALAASGEIVWNDEEIQASPHEKAKKMQGYTGAQRVDSGAMVEKQLTCSPVKGEKLQRTLLSLKALTSWFLSILCQLSQAGTETHQASANTNSHRLVEAVETNQGECVFSHFSQAFKMTCAGPRSHVVCFLLPQTAEWKIYSRYGKPSGECCSCFLVRSFSLGPTVTRTNALAVIRMLRRTGAKSRRCKEEVGEGRSKTEDRRLFRSQTTDYMSQQTKTKRKVIIGQFQFHFITIRKK